MANVVNQIGPYYFLHFRGPFQTIQKQLEVLKWPGVDGQALRSHGERCDPFQISAIVDVADKAAAKTALDNCIALKGGDPVAFVYRDIDFDPLKVDVLDVMLEDLRATPFCVGGINLANGAAGVIVTLRFTLIVTTVPEA